MIYGNSLPRTLILVVIVGMEGNGARGLPRRRLRPVMFQIGPGEPFQQFVPGRRVDRRCDCWQTYSYPNQVVLAIVDERQRLANANARANGRIQELETRVLEEQQRIETLREQLQEANNRLAQMAQQLRERGGEDRGLEDPSVGNEVERVRERESLGSN